MVVALSLSACGLSGSGAVDVLYAGSLVRLMEQELGPRFTETTGYRFVGFAAGSVELANEIKGGVARATSL